MAMGEENDSVFLLCTTTVVTQRLVGLLSPPHRETVVNMSSRPFYAAKAKVNRSLQQHRKQKVMLQEEAPSKPRPDVSEQK